MKKGLFLLSLIVTFYALGTVSASAVTNDTVKVGLRYGSSVMSSANLENDEGSVGGVRRQNAAVNAPALRGVVVRENEENIGMLLRRSVRASCGHGENSDGGRA